MSARSRITAAIFLAWTAVLLLNVSAWGRRHEKPPFRYVAGTEAMPEGCGGKLELTESAMVFECPEGSLSVPYRSVTQMEYLPQVSKKIRKMKLPWTIKPTSARNKNEGFFTVLYSDQGRTHAIILETRPDTMRPYLAELNLRTGQIIENRQD
ncbi:MAG TPA: hypothetical protein VFC10_16025 [Terriglobia bacterium]|nr:hypothetical protein [Terriglobia bacterium]